MEGYPEMPAPAEPREDAPRPREGQPGPNGGPQGYAEGYPEGRRRNRNRRKKDKHRDSREPRDNGGGHPGEPFEGMLELIGDKKFGFIRAISTSLQKGDNDPFMPPPLIQKHNLRDGVALKGIIKPGRKGAWQVTRVDEVMGMDPDAWKETAEFDDGLVIYPDEKLNLVTGPSDVSMRVVDLVAPLGKGQRALIVAPPRAGKTVILKQIAAGLAQNHPEVKLIALLIDERPEEVTDFRRNTQATVFASSNDFGEDNHIRVATLAFEYARRLVEQGHDVVILLDSLTRLGRTFNLWGGNSGRTMSGGLDARALLMPRKIFGSARNIEHGGSLTIIATALIETNSRMDEVIFEEFKGTGNAEIVLDRELADKRIYPAINVRKSGTRNEERLMSDEQIRQRHMLFRVLNERHPVEAMQALVKQIQRSPTNVHLLNELIPEQTY
jgi:transcription termination factor Rho